MILIHFKRQFERCKLQITRHAVKRFIEKNFPAGKLRKMIFRGRWFPHFEPEKVICVCKEDIEYWTIILAPTRTHIFIITAYPSSITEKQQFHKGKELSNFEITDNG